jgi:hypothetical protein
VNGGAYSHMYTHILTTIPAVSQHTYEYNTLNHKGLVAFAKEEFGINVQGCDTQTIIC